MAYPLSREEHDAIEKRIQDQTELIVAAAVRHRDIIIMVERPDRHGHCLNFLHRYGIDPIEDNHECGFVTNRGRFVGRKEAGQIVIASKQGTYMDGPSNPHGHLYSEDMWGIFYDEEVNPEDIF